MSDLVLLPFGIIDQDLIEFNLLSELSVCRSFLGSLSKFALQRLEPIKREPFSCLSVLTGIA